MSAKTRRSVPTPNFGDAVIQSGRQDGYWVESIRFHKDDRVPGIIASGLNSGRVEFLENPLATWNGDPKTKPDVLAPWKSTLIAQLDSPVAVACVDITGNGLTDVLVCHDYGPFMLDCNPAGGWITWLENPGREVLKLGGQWTQRKIGRWPAMHRIKFGYFTQMSALEIIGASVVTQPHDKTTPIPVIRFQRPEKVLEAKEWQRDIIDDEHFTLIHEITVRKFHGPSGLDSMLISSREGLTHVYYADQRWHRELLNAGIPRELRQDPAVEAPGTGDHWGTGCADAGRVGSDPFAYIATLDPFHGIAACVLTKEDDGLAGAGGWKRHVLDVYGTPNQQLKTGDGPGHFIVCADFDGDGDDEFLLSLFGPVDRDSTGEAIPPPKGPHPFKGIMYYKALDLKNGIFAKWKIAEDSSARIALGDFTGNGKIDLVSMGYNVKRYYEEPNTVVTLHPNNIHIPRVADVTSSIVSTLWDNEALLYIPDPTADPTDPKRVKKLRYSTTLNLIAVANHKVSINVLAADAKQPIDEDEGFKVLWGIMSDEKGPRTALGVPSFTAASTLANGRTITAGPCGAIYLRFTPIFSPQESAFAVSPQHEGSDSSSYHVIDTDQQSRPSVPAFVSAETVPLKPYLTTTTHGLSLPPPAFTRVEDLWWGGKFKGVAFANLSGFHFRFVESKDALAHLQFWTAGKDVNCGVHNHSDAIFEEVHVCLVPGTTPEESANARPAASRPGGNIGTGISGGGMSRLKKEYESTPPDKLDALPASAFDHLPLRALEEHGGMWYRKSDGAPERGDATKGEPVVVKYLWHKWQAGGGEGVDVWAAIEFNPDVNLGS